jgi:uncharacterized protein (DUF2252 family)
MAQSDWRQVALTNARTSPLRNERMILRKTKRFQPPHWDERPSKLTQARNFKMARSAHAYVRGSTGSFYEWLDSIAPQSLPEGPPIWICGDCHIGNLGPVTNADGDIEIQIRDFDQTVIGNPTHDLVRLALSLAMAARGSDLPGVTTARMVEQLVEGYSEAFAGDSPASASERPDSVYTALTDVQRRTWKHLARERTESETAALPIGRRFWRRRPRSDLPSIAFSLRKSFDVSPHCFAIEMTTPISRSSTPPIG